MQKTGLWGQSRIKVGTGTSGWGGIQGWSWSEVGLFGQKALLAVAGGRATDVIAF